MFDYIFREIKRKPWRTAGSVLSFAFGVCIFTVCSILLYSNTSRLWDILSGTGTHFIAYKLVCCDLPYIEDQDQTGFFTNGIPTNPFPREIADTISDLDSVKDASAFIQFRIKNKQDGKFIDIGGVPPGNAVSIQTNSCSASDITEGRFFNANDKRAVVLDAGYAKINNLHAKDILSLPDGDYEIIGIVNSGVKPVKTDMYMPYAVLEKTMDFYANISLNGLANIILVESKNSLVHSKAIQEVEAILGSDGITSSYNCFEPSALAIKINSGIVSSLLGVILTFLVLFTFRTFYVSINERRKDFGILYSLGWSRSRLSALTMLEGLLQTSAGAFFGFALSIIVISFLPDSIMLLQGTDLDSIPVIAIVLRSFLLTLGAGVIAGGLPALTFLRKTPDRLIKGR